MARTAASPGLVQTFVVVDQPLVGGQPGDCTLNNATVRACLNAARSRRRLRANPRPDAADPPVLRDLQLPPERFAQPILQSSISRVGPDQLNGRKLMLQIRQEVSD